MLFHVAIKIHLPHDMDAARAKQLSADESEQARELQRQGKWRHLWRIVG